MKKLSAFLLAVILLFGTVGVTAFAATKSPETNGVISGSDAQDKNDNKVSITFEEIDGKVVKEFQNGLDTLKEESGENNLQVVAQYDVNIEGTPQYPVTVSLDVLGVSTTSKVYVLVKEGGNIKAIETTVSDSKVTFSIDSKITRIAIVVDKQTATNVEKENNVLSPKTSDVSLAVAFMGVLAAMAAVVVYKKVKA